MTTRTRPAILLLLVAAAAASASPAAAAPSERGRQGRRARAEQEKNPPKLEDTTTEKSRHQAVKVDARPGRGRHRQEARHPASRPVDPDKLIAQDLIVGTGKEAKDGDTVDVRYVGVLRKDGKEFDSLLEARRQQLLVHARWRPGHPGLGPGRRRDEGRRASPAASSPPTSPTATRARLRRSRRTPRSSSTSTSRRSPRPSPRRDAPPGRVRPPRRRSWPGDRHAPRLLVSSRPRRSRVARLPGGRAAARARAAAPTTSPPTAPRWTCAASRSARSIASSC